MSISLNPNKSMEDWFLVAILERYEAYDCEENKIEFMRRFMIAPASSTRPDYYVWAHEKEGRYQDVFIQLCREMVEDYEPFCNLPEAFKTSLLHYLELEIQDSIEFWIHEIKRYAWSDGIEHDDYEDWWINANKDDCYHYSRDEICVDNNCASGNCRTIRQLAQKTK
jgi:hypothetical protein